MTQKTGERIVTFQRLTEPEIAANEPQPLDFGDALHTSTNSGAVGVFEDKTPFRLAEWTRLVIERPSRRAKTALINLQEGQIYVSSRDSPESISIITPQAELWAFGTEYVVRVDPKGNQTEVTMFQGEVEVDNGVSNEHVRSGNQATAVRGQQIKVGPIEAKSLVQWWIYYPGVIDPDELDLTPPEDAELGPSLESYRSGDLQGALQKLPDASTPGSEDKRIYLAGVMLAVGAVDRSQSHLASVSSNAPLAIALRTMIDAVQQKVGEDQRRFPSFTSTPRPPQTTDLTASEWLALSYHHQSTNGLKEALQAATNSVGRSPRFGFGWARVAELEFSFGRIGAARRSLDQALKLAPHNAQAHALNGFLLAAQNRTGDARVAFDKAIELDPALANGWLGRGLCKIRQSWAVGPSAFRLPPSALEDLQTAAILEPSRSLLRSYLGKAFADTGFAKNALKELAVAKHFDTNDPTAWLYSALLLRDQNRINPAVSDLEKSIELNDNRALYRSRFLLDEDRAVRSSSLAPVYQDAGMNEVAVHEAARAVSYDYANYSSHLFLSDSYNQLRDPTRFNLRYETPWFNELLLANLLSPVGGTPLSQNISQQEYVRLFDRNRIGLSTDSSYRSDGQYRVLASQFGALGNTAWSLDLDYQHNNGVRPNNELDRIEWYSTIKQQLSPQDSVLLLTKYQDYHSGDNFQYYEPTNARPHFTFDEDQSPIIFGGYHHEWSPGIHTLLLAGRLENDQRISDIGATQTLVFRRPNNRLAGDPELVNLDVTYRSQFEAFSAEAQQVFDSRWQSAVFGSRWQGGEFDTRNLMTNPSGPQQTNFPNPAADAHTVEDFQRVSAYAYETLKFPAHLRFTGGLTYEYLRYPENFRSPPIQPGETTRERLNPKAALLWEASPEATFRGVYARSLGGVSLDESYRLEPTQLNGFSQAFRTLIPESLVGSVAAPDHEIWGAALDLKFKTRTYFGLQGEVLGSEVEERVGVFNFLVSPLRPPTPISASSTRRDLNYEEHAFTATLNQLLGDEWALGAQYRFVRSELETHYPELASRTVNRADLQRVTLSALYNHSSGFFAQADSQWYFQENFADASSLPGDSFQQLNLVAGYRFPRRRGDITLGVLNVTGEDYRLNPVTPYVELPRERVFYARLRFRF